MDIWKKGDGYIALYSQHGYEWSSEPKFTREELICSADRNIWLCQLGSRRENGTFADFMAHIQAGKLVMGDEEVDWTIPGVHSLRFELEGPLLVNGRMRNKGVQSL